MTAEKPITAVPDASIERLITIQHKCARAARESGRPERAVSLICVSKTCDAPDIIPVLEAGQRVFGENRVQEAQGKWPALKLRYPDTKLHLIGPLQSNKARDAVELFDAIHTVDRVSIAAAIAKEVKRLGRQPELFIQVNTGAESQKAGVAPDEADGFFAQCRDEFGLSITGLMCIPPVLDAPSPHFALLSKIGNRNGLHKFSMGMSNDFEQAIMLGASHVRVGSAIFGERTA